MPKNIVKKPEKPRLSQGQIIVCFLIIYLITKIILGNISGQKVTASDLSNENILTAVNRERSMRNLTTFKTDNRLGLAADTKSKDMIARHYFSHTDPDGNYIWPTIVAAGYTPYIQLGENLAIEFYNTESLISAWMNSPTHRANILNEGFKDQGMGIEFGNTQEGQYHSAITNTFGTLAMKKSATEPATETQNAAPPPSPPASAAEPIKNVKPASETPKKVTTPLPAPLPAAESPKIPTTVEKSSLPIALRGNIQQPSFNVSPSHASNTPEQTEDLQKEIISKREIANLFGAGQIPSNPLLNKINRYISISLIVILILLLIADMKVALEKKLGSLDKKANNLLLLVLALVVIAFMYWL